MTSLQRLLTKQSSTLTYIFSGFDLSYVAQILGLKTPYIVKDIPTDGSEHELMEIIQKWNAASAVIVESQKWDLLEQLLEEHNVDYDQKPHFVISPYQFHVRSLPSDPFIILGGSHPQLLTVIRALTGTFVSPLKLLDRNFFIYFHPKTNKLITSHHVTPHFNPNT